MKYLSELRNVDLEKIDARNLAVLLKKALSHSKCHTMKELVDKTDLNYNTVKGYFGGSNKPTKDKFEKIVSALESCSDISNLSSPSKNKEIKGIRQLTSKRHSEAREKATHLSYLLRIALDYLEFFKNSNVQDREILRKILSSEDVGYFTSLFASLFDENHLKIWETFQQDQKGKYEGK